MRNYLLTGLVLILGIGTTRGADAPLPKLELQETAEVHYVGVYEPLPKGVTIAEVTGWQALVKAFRGKDGPGAHIRKSFSKDLADDILTEEVENGRIGDLRPGNVDRIVRQKLAMLLNQAIQTGNFYDKDAFAKVVLTKPIKDVVELGDNRTTFQTQWMNRELLALAFPNSIAPTPANFQTVYVTVKAGKPVVLVFSSYHQCRWCLAVEKGATVAGVVLYGGFAQVVTGTDAPVVYRAGKLPNGKRGTIDGLHASKQDDSNTYKRVIAEIKEITSKELTSFQGQYQPGPEPFVVKPGAK